MPRILIVEDSAFQRQLIRRALEQLGHEVTEAATGESGLVAAAKGGADCILVDILMPDMDGIRFLESLRVAEIGIPAIVLTADVQTSTASECLARGAVTVLNKPLRETELASALTAAIRDIDGRATP